MTVNMYAKKWCEEEYDVRDEDFFIANAYYVAKREWASAGVKHGIFALVIGFILSSAGSQNITEFILNTLVNVGILTFSFYLYGARRYDANNLESALFCYLLPCVIMFLTKKKVDSFVLVLFSIFGGVLYVYQTIIFPCKFRKIKNDIKQKMEQREAEEEKSDYQAYEQWASGYKAYRYGIPEHASNTVDPNKEQAEELFKGYTKTKEMLRTRYRQLAKQYHPDMGGTTELFQSIISVYEYYNKKLTT